MQIVCPSNQSLTVVLAWLCVGVPRFNFTYNLVPMIKETAKSEVRKGSYRGMSGIKGPQWFALNGCPARRIPSNQRQWLGDSRSLSWRIRATCERTFCVRVLEQRGVNVCPDEARALGIAAYKKVVVREVQLLRDGVPVVYARSLLPLIALAGPYAPLGKMGDVPLGERLFGDSAMRRGPLSFSWIERGSRRYFTALTGLHNRPLRLYGRRSLFYGARVPIMVSEFFLPGISTFPGR